MVLKKIKSLRKFFISIISLIISFILFSSVLFSANISSKHSLSILNSASARDRGLMNSSFLISKDSSALLRIADKLQYLDEIL